jgi:NAD(P)-dependent dehydrogenase (short-subunit alcohol dehydrogenase family)
MVDPLDPLGGLPENGHPIFAIRADLRNEADVARVVDIVLARFNQVDLIVNCTGQSRRLALLATGETANTLRTLYDANLVGPLQLALLVAQRFWRHRDRENTARNRSIVNVSGPSGRPDQEAAGHLANGMSNGAINLLSRYMATEFRAIGVRVNAIAPGRFPRQVPTDIIVRGILRLDRGQMNGRILQLDWAGGHVSARIN